MDSFIPVSEPLLNGNEKKYLCECIDTGWISSEGPFVQRLEKEFAEFSGQRYGNCVSNGTVAIELLIKAMKEEYNWQNDDEIIMPSFTIISSAQGVIYNKLKPVFIDSEELTWNMDTKKIEELITPKTQAIMPIHIYGLPTDMNPIFEIAKKYNLKIIEDAAQSHGQKYYDKVCGGMSDASTFSFYANKHIAAGEGGIILTSSDSLNEKIHYYRNLCFTKERFIHEDLGWNFRMSNLQAAVAYAQFEQLDFFIEKKKKMGQIYNEALKNLPLKLPCPKTQYSENNYWVYGIVLNDDVSFDAKEARKKLAELGIGTRPFFYPMHKQPALIKLGITDDINRPVSEKLYEKGFYIPSGLGLTESHQETVIKKLKTIF